MTVGGPGVLDHGCSPLCPHIAPPPLRPALPRPIKPFAALRMHLALALPAVGPSALRGEENLADMGT